MQTPSPDTDVTVTEDRAADTVDWAAYAPSADTDELRGAARAHFGSMDGPAAIRAMLDGQSSTDIWAELVDGGYTAIGLPEALDGMGDLTQLCAVLEEAGRALLHIPLSASAAAAQTLLSVGGVDAIDPSLRSTVAVVDGPDIVAVDGAGADAVVLIEAAEAGTVVRLVRVPSDATPLDAIDPSRRSVRFTADQAETLARFSVPADRDAVLASARICIAADLLGTAKRSLDASVVHATQREQFGQAIGAFQAVKHRLADTHVLIERAASLLLGAAVAAAGDPLGDEARRLARFAKAACAEAANRATLVHLQLLGAMGLTFEADSGIATRRARALSAHLGEPLDLYTQAAADTIGAGTHG